MSYSIFNDTMVEMSWPEVEKAINKGAVVLFPTGVIEEHGPHMSLGVDTYLSYLVCKLVKNELKNRGIESLIAPPFYWGINNVTGSFPGSFTIKTDTMKCIIRDILTCLKRWGVNYVFIINWHDDYLHCRTLYEALKETRSEIKIEVYFIISDILAKRLDIKEDDEAVLIYKMPSPKKPRQTLDIHAGAGETSVMVQYFPEEVNTQVAMKLKNSDIDFKDFTIWRKGWENARKLTPLGYLGNPSDFSNKKGKQFINHICTNTSNLIELTLKENKKQSKK